MHPFATYVLRCYNQATGWNDDNLYSNLTKSSRAILDFTVPRGVHFSISKSANASFNTSYAMNALPTLNGSIGYIFTSCDLELKHSATVPFKDVVDRFVIHDRPAADWERRDIPRGRNINAKEYLLYGRYYVPSSRLDALYSVRLSPTLQGLIAAVSNPRARFSPPLSSPLRESAGNVMFSLQHDTGRWCTEYSWSADDGMWGVRVLHNFGRLANEAIDAERVARKERERGTKRVDEEERMEGGLKDDCRPVLMYWYQVHNSTRCVAPIHIGHPRLQYTSANTHDVNSTFNPMMGHISAAYAARASRDLALCSRFDFNIYSYESEWTMGAEWWLRRAAGRRLTTDIQKEETENDNSNSSEPVALNDISPPGQDAPSPFPSNGIPGLGGDVTGVVKARISTSSDVSLMWEGRIRNMLVSLGVVSDLSNRSKPIKSIDSSSRISPGRSKCVC
ncbi:Mitochondrial distribution and morphology protein 10 [Rhizoctonia solani]|uniref:Mitochondrial distribution and morphology protein 10 n=1 Tax=Rhizoctonia solani TaxID=456999 RepID=A0A8H7IK06_9AGAM|nr:Mitochondrial distribution and morphology protein 10 [Rhizoctonia solani]